MLSSRLRIENLQIQLSNKVIINHLSKELKDKKITVILGKSGCGKSTLIKAIAGLVPHQGRIVNQYQSQGMVFQESRLIPWLTVEENILTFARLQNQKIESSQISMILEQLGLSGCHRLYPFELSGGMKMRVALARAFIFQPEILFLDEPFSALDEPTRYQLGRLLLKLKNEQQTTILMISHQIEESLMLADEVLLMGQGKIQASFDLSHLNKENSFYENQALMSIAQSIRNEYLKDLS